VPADLASAAAALERIWRAHVLPLVPPEGGLVDVHAHLGEDATDGSRLDLAGLLESMEAGGVTRSCAFPFQLPRGSGYAEANAEVLAAATAGGGRVVPFCRSEPGKRFRSERRVPMLFHTGRAVPPLARELAGLLERHPGAQVVLAHCAIADLHALCALRHPNIRFDTSLWNVLDVRALLGEAAPEQVLYGSDAPYYTPIGTQAKLFLQLAAAGASDTQRRDAAVGSAERLLAGAPCAQLSEPLAADLALPSLPRMRAHEYLVMTVPLVWQQMPDRIGLLALARQALAPAADERAQAALELIALAEGTWPYELEHGDRKEILTVSWLTFRLIELADALLMAA